MTNLTGDMIHSTHRILLLLLTAFTMANAVDVPKAATTVTKSLSEVIPFCLIGLEGDDDGNMGWVAMSPENSSEALGDTAAELIQYFSKLPQERKKKGIHIWGSLAHLKDAESSKAHMTDFQANRIADPKLLEAERSYIAKLTAACRKAGVSLWINTAINGSRENMEFNKLTQ
ncbi:hypothetical protein [Prosthecobacter sp.]|uniref:hypothetical protein n=1 Tax=Prosthecobacter sp. TaxID=1965333 RepID=UPI0037845A45